MSKLETALAFLGIAALVVLGLAIVVAFYWAIWMVLVFCVRHWWQLLIVVSTLTVLGLLASLVDAHCRKAKSAQ